MNMIEKIANEIYSTMLFGSPSFKLLDKQHSTIKEHYYKLARVVIQAMREPTEEMIKAGIHCGDGYGKQPETYQAMIDVALKQDLSELSNEELFRRAYPNGIGDVNSGRS